MAKPPPSVFLKDSLVFGVTERVVHMGKRADALEQLLLVLRPWCGAKPGVAAQSCPRVTAVAQDVAQLDTPVTSTRVGGWTIRVHKESVGLIVHRPERTPCTCRMRWLRSSVSSFAPLS